jgi:Xaa-Pro aminopeptidase
MSDRFAARRDRFWKLLRDTGVDAFLVSHELNVSWLTGFTGRQLLAAGDGQQDGDHQ